jgi:hypothetical protein
MSSSVPAVEATNSATIPDTTLQYETLRNIHGSDSLAAEEYWKHMVADVPGCLLPVADEPENDNGLKLPVSLPPQLREKLYQINPDQNCHLFFWQSIWAIALRYYVGNEDITFSFSNVGPTLRLSADLPLNSSSDHICSIQIQEQDTVLEVLNKVWGRYKASPRQTRALHGPPEEWQNKYNTAVVSRFRRPGPQSFASKYENPLVSAILTVYEYC